MFTFFYNAFLFVLIFKAGDIELNPAPNKNSHSYLSCCHWNVNSLATDNYSKVVALKTYNSIYKYDFISINETFLDSSFDSDNKDLMFEGYNLIRSKARDIELNPAPNKNSHSYLSCCHWNVHSLAKDNYSKVVALKTYNSIYKYDFISINETFLDSSFDSDKKDLMFEGYNLIRSDHPSNTKRGGVCIYYKESLTVCIVDITSLPK